MSKLDDINVAWCKNVFNSLRDGGTWGVPRSGLVYNKREGKLVLTAFMPWMPEMTGTITPSQLLEQQRSDHESNKRHFADAGITIEDVAGLEAKPPE